MTTPIENPAAEILKTNLPKRKDLVEGLESFQSEDSEAILAKISGSRANWDELGVVLDEEKELQERFEHMAVTLEQKAEALQKSAKDSELEVMSLIRELEQASKGSSTITQERFVEIQAAWKALKVENSGELFKRFTKAEEKMMARLKGEATQAKIKVFEEVVQELEAMKGNVELKLSERQNLLKKHRETIKSLELHSGPQVSKLRERFNTLNQELSQELGWERWSSSKRKEDLVAKSAAILDGSQPCEDYRATLTQIQAEWKEIGFTTREDDALWEKFKTNCDGIYAKVKDDFEKNEVAREEILTKIEALKDSMEWKKTADEIQKLQSEWKAFSNVSRKAARKQGDRFRKLCDHFFNRRRDHLKEQRGHQKDNLKEKQSLIEQVKRLQTETNWRHSLPKVRECQDRWKAIGPVPRKQSESIWKEFQEACSVVYEKRRADDAERDKEFEGNLAKKEELLEQLKTLLEGKDLSAIRTGLGSIDKNWQEAGRVPRNKQRDIEDKYRKLVKSFDDREKEAQAEKQKQLDELSVEKASICRELEAHLFQESWDAGLEMVASVKERWDALGMCSQEKALKKRFRKAHQWLSQASTPQIKKQIETESEQAKEQFETTLLKLEKLAGIESGDSSPAAMRQMMIAELQAKMGKNKAFGNKKDEAASLVNELRGLGPINPEVISGLEGRVEAASKKLAE
jgi:hypothetical protein